MAAPKTASCPLPRAEAQGQCRRSIIADLIVVGPRRHVRQASAMVRPRRRRRGQHRQGRQGNRGGTRHHRVLLVRQHGEYGLDEAGLGRLLAAALAPAGTAEVGRGRI